MSFPDLTYGLGNTFNRTPSLDSLRRSGSCPLDILGGVEMGYRTVLVLSGGTDITDLSQYGYQPDVIVDSIADLCTPTYLLSEVGV